VAKLNDDERTLLLDVVLRRHRERDDLVRAVTADELSAQQRSELCEIIGAEFAEQGLDSDSEPTNYGLRLELLLDVVNRPNVGR
jgi:hypothetical protein